MPIKRHWRTATMTSSHSASVSTSAPTDFIPGARMKCDSAHTPASLAEPRTFKDRTALQD